MLFMRKPFIKLKLPNQSMHKYKRKHIKLVQLLYPTAETKKKTHISVKTIMSTKQSGLPFQQNHTFVNKCVKQSGLPFQPHICQNPHVTKCVKQSGLQSNKTTHLSKPSCQQMCKAKWSTVQQNHTFVKTLMSTNYV